MQDNKRVPTLLVPRAGARVVDVLPVPAPRRLDGIRAVLGIMLWAAGNRLSGIFGRLDKRRDAARLRTTLEGLGGVWVKVGQLVAMRPDIFDREYCEELSRLQDHATGFPFEDVRQILYEELGCPLEAVYAEFEEKPFAAASIGQIHRAKLLESGVDVAVKVQRPTIKASFERDLAMVAWITRTADRMGFLPHVRWNDLYWELERTLLEELDYRLESSYLRRMRKRLRAHKILVPKVYEEYSRGRCLTMEFIRGALMSNYLKVVQEDPARARAWLVENGINTVKVAKTLYLSHCRQLFEDRMFHADLHPGNIVLLRDSRIALIDFGSVGVLEESFLREYSNMVEAISRQDFKKAADLFLVMAPTLPRIDLEGVREEMIRSLRSWSVRATTRSLPYHEKSLTQSIGEIGRIYAKYRMATSWAFMRVNRAQLTMDASLMYLWPDMNYVNVVKRYYRERAGREIRAQLNLPSIAQRGLKSMSHMGQILEDYSEEAAYDVARLRRGARNLEATASIMAAALGGAARRGAVVALALLFCSLLALAHQRTGYGSTGLTGLALDHFPRLHDEEWIAVLLAEFVVWRGLRSLARLLLTPETRE